MEKSVDVKEATIKTTFPVGKISITLAAAHILRQKDVLECLQRHANRDWGGVLDNQRQANNASVSSDGVKTIVRSVFYADSCRRVVQISTFPKGEKTVIEILDR